MIEILKRWLGKFEINGKIVDISDVNFKDGEEFDIILSPNVEDDDEK